MNGYFLPFFTYLGSPTLSTFARSAKILLRCVDVVPFSLMPCKDITTGYLFELEWYPCGRYSRYPIPEAVTFAVCCALAKVNSAVDNTARMKQNFLVILFEVSNAGIRIGIADLHYGERMNYKISASAIDGSGK